MSALSNPPSRSNTLLFRLIMGGVGTIVLLCLLFILIGPFLLGERDGDFDYIPPTRNRTLLAQFASNEPSATALTSPTNNSPSPMPSADITDTIGAITASLTVEWVGSTATFTYLPPTHLSPTVPASTTTPEATATLRPSDTATGTSSPRPSNTSRPTATNSNTPTRTIATTNTPRASASPTRTPSSTPSASPSPSSSVSVNRTATRTASMTPSATRTRFPRHTHSPTPSPSHTASRTQFPSVTTSPTASVTPSPSRTLSPSNTASATASRTASVTSSPTSTNTASPSVTPQPSHTSIPSPTASPSSTMHYPNGRQLQLLYNISSFYVANPNQANIEIGPLGFEALDSLGNLAGRRFSGSEWAQIYAVVEPNGCVAIEVFGAQNTLEPSLCSFYNATTNPPATSSTIFWVAQANISQFAVFWNETEIARCEIAAGQCVIFVP